MGKGIIRHSCFLKPKSNIIFVLLRHLAIYIKIIANSCGIRKPFPRDKANFK